MVDRCRAMLQTAPETREDYELAWIEYLVRYHGLDAEAADQVLDCVRGGAPSFRTVANRIQELIRADAELRPPKSVMDLRQKQRYQGRVR